MPGSTEAQQRYLQKRRAEAKAYLGGSCQQADHTCQGELEFDHLDSSTKCFNIATAIAKHMSWDKMLPELIKCQLLCEKHHREKTSIERDWDTDLYSFECPQCSTAFHRKKRQVNGQKTFCSRSCSASFYGRVTQMARVRSLRD